MTDYTKLQLNTLTKSKTIISNAVKREAELNKICKKVWEFTNPSKQSHIYGLYCNPDNKKDETIVTIGFMHPTLSIYLTSRS